MVRLPGWSASNNLAGGPPACQALTLSNHWTLKHLFATRAVRTRYHGYRGRAEVREFHNVVVTHQVIMCLSEELLTLAQPTADGHRE